MMIRLNEGNNMGLKDDLLFYIKQHTENNSLKDVETWLKNYHETPNITNITFIILVSFAKTEIYIPLNDKCYSNVQEATSDCAMEMMRLKELYRGFVKFQIKTLELYKKV